MDPTLLHAVLQDNIHKYQDEELELETNLFTHIFLYAAELNGATDAKPIRCYDGQYTGMNWVVELLHHPHPKRFRNQFRMHPNTFLKLCKLLHDTYQLRSTRRFNLIESVAMFIFILGTGASYRDTCERFQHSAATISNHFYKVLDAFEKMAPDFICPLEDNRTSYVHQHIAANRMYYPFFKDCIGAIDGTHVSASTPQDKLAMWTGRKGVPTQNVLGVCDFNMRFTYLAAGYEGRVHDTRVLSKEMNADHQQFPVAPDGKYYLADSGYPNMRGFLTPYKQQRYHFQEFRTVRPRNNEEKFNRAHSSLRSVIERSFGVLKKRFQILKLMPTFPLQTQPRIVAACVVIHNFIIQYDNEDKLINKWRVPGANIRAEPDFSTDGDESADESPDENELSQPQLRIRRRRRHIYTMRNDADTNMVRDEIRDFMCNDVSNPFSFLN